MKTKIVGASIAAAIVIAVIVVIVFVGPIDVSAPKKEDQFKTWNTSGPFHINKFEYIMGENVFISAEGLKYDEVGNMVFLMPNNTKKYIVIPFNGTQKPDFNQYFKPSLSKSRNICSIDDLVGQWTIILQGTSYDPIKFTMKNETLPTEAGTFSKVC